jgi:transposase
VVGRVECLVERCAGLDIGKADLKACVRVPGSRGGRRSETRTFATTSGALLGLREWLIEQGVTVVAMEATGDYWKPPYYLLEGQFEVQLLNAAHMRNVPGRKTDVSDAAWIAQLVEHGLVRPSFVPPPPIRRLRDLTGTVALRDRRTQAGRSCAPRSHSASLGCRVCHGSPRVPRRLFYCFGSWRGRRRLNATAPHHVLSTQPHSTGGRVRSVSAALRGDDPSTP